MATYILQDKYNSRNFDKDYPYHVIEAQGGLDGIKKEAYNKVPNGHYTVYTKNGKRFGSVSISEESKRKAERKRPVLPKEQYNQLYFYVEIGMLTRAKVPQGKNPLDYIPVSPRRYDSLTEARRAALSNSHKTYTNNKAMEKYYDNWTANHPTEMCVFHGPKFLGTVEYAPIKGVDGFWTPAGSKDPRPMNKDGTL